MEQRQLGRSGLSVSAIGLGCMGMSGTYGPRDEAQCVATLERALDLGVTFIDTSNAYGQGHNETLIGRVYAGRYGRITIGTKCGITGRNETLGVDGSPAHIKESCEGSLKRLRTDVIDLYYLHRPDPKVPIEDSVGAMAELKNAGKIRHIGLSGVNAATLRRAVREHPIAALQSEYSVFTRHIEDEILPACRELGIGLVPFSPLGRAMLTGTIRSAQDMEQKGDARLRAMPRFQGDNLAHNLALMETIETIASAHRATPGQIALAWVLEQGADIAPIPGTTKPARLEENAGATKVRLTDDDKAILAGLAAKVQGSRFSPSLPVKDEIDTPPRR